jgi:hypothetical protein
MTKKEEKQFAKGIWYAAELLTIYFNSSELAVNIIHESGIKKGEFEEILEETDYEKELMTEKVLDRLD